MSTSLYAVEELEKFDDVKHRAARSVRAVRSIHTPNGDGKADHAATVSFTVAHTLQEEQRTTDLANARRLVRKYAKDLRYCFAFGKWLVWDGRRWPVDNTGEASRRAKEIVRGIFAEAMNDSLSGEERQALAKWAIRSESETRIQAMLSLAQSEPGMPVTTEELDRDPMLLNCLNGTIDLRTGKLRPHDRHDRITRVLDVEYDPGANCPLWDAFLYKIMGESQPLIDFLRRAVGYTLTGQTIERVLFILFGEGANGKSVFTETIAALLGGYAKRTPTSTLMIKRNDGIPNDIAALRGMRLVHASESEQGRRLAESQIKDWTGGDTIAARFLHREFFEFKPEFKIWLRTNHKPKIIGTDEAIWDRIKLIPFAVRIEKGDQDKALAQKLLAELPGILAWAVRGCLEWQGDGLDVPAAVETASQQYRLEMDSFSNFVEACCVVGPNMWALSKDLRLAYKAWAEANGERYLLEGRDFEERLRGLGCEAKSKHAGRGWEGIGLAAA
jgi:putative DNA primase/helicase